MLHQTASYSIYFGNAEHSFNPLQLQGCLIANKQPFSQAPLPPLKQLIFLRQIHSARGMVVTDEDINTLLPSFSQEGDFLITNQPGIGLGVATGDCLPIVLIDENKRAISVVHAGWKGSVNEVAIRALDRMNFLYGTMPEQIQVFFGPSAQICCYQVQDDFRYPFLKFSYADQAFVRRETGLYFDVPLFNTLQLVAAGVPAQAINLDYQVCTICSPGYCSVRKSPGSLERQMTVVSLASF